VSRKNAVLDQQEFGRVDQGEAVFPLQEGKHPRPLAMHLYTKASHSQEVYNLELRM
jgi:hypothetical protein